MAIKRYLAVMTGMVLLGAAPAGGEDTVPQAQAVLLPPDRFTTLPQDLITPHVAFAKPLKSGPVKALFLVPHFLGRDVVELWQRFDLEYNAFVLLGDVRSSTPYETDSYVRNAFRGLSKEELEKDLLKKLDANPEVIVLVDADLTKAPLAAQEKVLALVKNGTGLVMTYRGIPSSGSPFLAKEDPAGRERIASGAPWSGLPELFPGEGVYVLELPAKVITTYTCGQGRVAAIRFRSELLPNSYLPGEDGLAPCPYELGYSREWDDRYGRYLSLAAKAILWTSGRRQQWTLSLPPDGTRMPRSVLPKADGFEIKVTGSEPGRANLLVEIRDPLGEVELTNRMAIEIKDKEAVAVLTQAVPKLKAGLHYLDARLLVEEKTVDWGSLAFRVTAPEEIVAIKLDEESVERGGELRGRIFFSGTLGDESMKLRVRVIDTNGRIYAETHQKPLLGNTVVPISSFRLDDPSTIASHVEVEIARGEEVVARAATVAYVPKRNMEALDADEFPHLIWGPSMTGLAAGMIETRQLRKAGFNIGLGDAHPVKFRNMALWDIVPAPHGYRFMVYADEKGGVRLPWSAPFLHDTRFEITDGSLANPEIKDNVWEWVRYCLADAKRYGPFFYNISDECFYRGDFGFSPWGMKAYQKYLAARYGSLDRLNTEWKANYTSFQEVPRLTPGQADAQQNMPAKIDHRSAMEMEWREMFAFLAEKIRQYDPRAKVGTEASETHDLEAMLSGVDYWTFYSYGADRNDVLGRCVRKSRGFAGAWSGAYSEFQTGRWAATRLWEQLFQGFLELGYYFSGSTGSMGNLMADLSYTDFFKTQLPDFELIHGGIGQLLRTCQVKPSGVGIHWSQASRLGFDVPFESGAPLDPLKAVDGALISILKKQHIINWDYITGRQLENKPELALRERVIFLPISQCLSDGEVSTLKKFVEQGGLLVGDGFVGTRSIFGRELGKGQLDEVFGVQMKAPAEAREVQGIKTTFTWKGKTLPLESVSNNVNASITAAGSNGKTLAEAAGVPLVVVNRYGKGDAVLLNFNPARCNQEALSGMVMGLLNSVDVSAPVRFLPEPGPAERYGLLEKGELTLLGVVMDYHPGKWNGGKVILPQARHIYDVKAGQYLGNLREIEVKGQADMQSAALFALQSEKIKSVSLTAPEIIERDKPVTIACAVSADGRFSCAGRVVRIELRGPDGQSRTHYRRMAYLKEYGRGKLTVEFALNDPTGDWEVMARDIASGLSTTAKFVLK